MQATRVRVDSVIVAQSTLAERGLAKLLFDFRIQTVSLAESSSLSSESYGVIGFG